MQTGTVKFSTLLAALASSRRMMDPRTYSSTSPPSSARASATCRRGSASVSRFSAIRAGRRRLIFAA